MLKSNGRGGNKSRKKKKTRKVEIYDDEEEGQFFGKIIKNNGGTFSILQIDGTEKIGKLKGTMKRGPRIFKDSYVMCSLRDYGGNMCDILGISVPPRSVINSFEQLTNKTGTKDFVQFEDDNNEFEGIDKIKIDENKNDIYGGELLPGYDDDDDDDNDNDDDNDEKHLDFDDYEENMNQINLNEGLDELDLINEMMNLSDNNLDDMINDDEIISDEKENKKNKKNNKKKNSEKELKKNEEEVEKDINFNGINFDDIDMDNLNIDDI